MTKAELIEALKDFPDDMDVKFWDYVEGVRFGVTEETSVTKLYYTKESEPFGAYAECILVK